MCVSAGLRCEAGEKCALLGRYAASSGNFLPTFRDSLSVQSAGLKNLEILVFIAWFVKMGPICCAETSIRYDHYSLSDNQEKRISHFWVLYAKFGALQFGSKAWQVVCSGTGLVQTKYNSAEENLSFWSPPMEHVSACTPSLRLRGLCSCRLWRSWYLEGIASLDRIPYYTSLKPTKIAPLITKLTHGSDVTSLNFTFKLGRFNDWATGLTPAECVFDL